LRGRVQCLNIQISTPCIIHCFQRLNSVEWDRKMTMNVAVVRIWKAGVTYFKLKLRLSSDPSDEIRETLH
jgi:hypothetical protein